MNRFLKLLTSFLLAAVVGVSGSENAMYYEINFIGLKDEAILKSMFDVSDLVILQDRPPATLNGLRYRASSDIPSLLRVLRAYGYYDATITYELEIGKKGPQVSLLIHPGTQYSLGSYEIFHKDCTVPLELPFCEPFTIETLGLQINKPFLAVNIVNAELALLEELARIGYPLASIEKRRVIVDMQTKQTHAAACVNEGPFSKFGPLTIFGLKTVSPDYVLGKIAWNEGCPYTPDDVEETQKRLLNSNLFSSVLISHDEKLDEMGELPMKMRLSEAKHKQVSVGAFYATVDGPGMNFNWTHRNLRGLGESISISAEGSKRYIAGSATYKKPDFLMMDQTYRAVAELEREDIRAYHAFIYRAANYLDKKLDNRRNLSFGFELEHFNVSHSASNGTYLLASLPVFARYTTADDQLNPTRGYTLVYQASPYQSLFYGNQRFFKQRITTTFYIPVWKKWLVFAGRVQFGSIAGTKQKHIPLPALFLGGSEDDLRGYRYMTVSPLNEHRKPYGGRSAVFLTAETRIRFTETLGLVPFADFGTVTFDELPTFNAKWFKSVGLGLRYFTFFGPLRFDVGFPLDRRQGVDPSFRIYASIGQTF
jgi:translocation and assembly module TamA